MIDARSKSAGRIFISYRRQDTAFPAGWLYDRLAERFGPDQVFKDVDDIEVGDDFVDVLTNAVGSCDILIALIGKGWLRATGPNRVRRLDDPNDFVRLEIEAALARGVLLIPILVEGASMPRQDKLPASISKLARRQALELSPHRFHTDTEHLLDVMERTLADLHPEADSGSHREPMQESTSQASEGHTPEASAPTNQQEQATESEVTADSGSKPPFAPALEQTDARFDMQHQQQEQATGSLVGAQESQAEARSEQVLDPPTASTTSVAAQTPHRLEPLHPPPPEPPRGHDADRASAAELETELGWTARLDQESQNRSAARPGRRRLAWASTALVATAGIVTVLFVFPRGDGGRDLNGCEGLSAAGCELARAATGVDSDAFDWDPDTCTSADRRAEAKASISCSPRGSTDGFHPSDVVISSFASAAALNEAFDEMVTKYSAKRGHVPSADKPVWDTWRYGVEAETSGKNLSAVARGEGLFVWTYRDYLILAEVLGRSSELENIVSWWRADAPDISSAAGVECWDGTTADAGSTCPSLTGRPALEWAARLDKTKKPACKYTTGSSKAVESYACAWKDLQDGQASLFTSRWADNDAAVDDIATSGRDFAVTKFRSGRIYASKPEDEDGDGVFVASRIYLYSGFPISITAYGRGETKNDSKQNLEAVDSRFKLVKMDEVDAALAGIRGGKS